MQNQENQIKQKNRYASWWKILLLVLFLGFVSAIFIVPRYYAHHIFQPILMDGFAKLTHGQYQIEFKNIKWSILKNSFSLEQVHVGRNLNDSLPDSSKKLLESFALNRVELKGFKYLDFLLGNAHFRSVNLDNLMVFLNQDSSQDTNKIDEKPFNSNSEILQEIAFDVINLKHIDICLIDQQDSLWIINNGELRMLGFELDSLGFSNSIKTPQFDSMSLRIDNSELQLKDQSVYLNQIQLNTSKQLDSPEFSAQEVLLKNMSTGNTLVLKDALASFQIHQLLSGLQKGEIRSQKFLLNLGSISSHVLKQIPINPELELNEWMRQLAILNQRIYVDTIELNIDKMNLLSSENEISIQDLGYKMFGNAMADSIWDFHHFVILTHDILYKSKENQDSLSLKSFDYNDQNQNLTINGFYYQSDEKSSSVLSFQEASLKDIDVFMAFKEQKIKISNLLLDHPQLIVSQFKKAKSHNVFTSLKYDVDIRKTQINHLNLQMEPIGFNLENSDIKIDSLKIYANKPFVWYEIFQEIEADLEFMKYEPSNEQLSAQIIQAHFSSAHGRIRSSKINLAWTDENKNDFDLQAKELKLDGLNWRSLIENTRPIILDTCILDYLSVNGTLVGKNSQQTTVFDSSLLFQCKYLKLPNIHSNLQIKMDNYWSKVLLNKLSIYAQSFSIDTRKPEWILFNDLQLSSLKSSYHQPKDSLYIDFGKWSLDMKKHIWSSEDMVLSFMSSNSEKQTKSKLQLKIPSTYISGIDPINYQIKKEIALDSVNVRLAELIFKGERNSQIQYTGESQNLYDSFRELVEGFSLISMKHCVVSDFKIGVKNRYLHRMDEVEIDKIDFDIKDFYIDYTALNLMDRFLFSEEVSFKMNKYFQSINNGQQLIYLNSADISNIDNRLYFNDLRVLTLGNSAKMPMNVFVKDILLKDFNVIPGIKHPQLYIGNILFNEATLDVRNQQDEAQSNMDMERLNLFPYIHNELSAITIDHIELEDVDLNISGMKDFGKQNLNFQGIHLSADQLQLDSNNRIFTDKKFFYCDDIRVVFPQFSMVSSNRFYDFGFQKLAFSSRSKYIFIDSLSLKPRYDKRTFTANLEFQKDRIELLIPSLSIAQIDYRDIIFRKRYKAQKILLDSPQAVFFKDKTIAADTAAFKAMPAQLLGELPYYLSIDTVEVNSGKIRYEELTLNTPQEAYIYFDQININMTGLSNDEDLRNFGGALKLTANAEVMSKSRITLSTVFPLNSPDQDFVMIASLGSINAREFNPILQPLAMISASSGYVDHMQLNVKGNEKEAIGEMILKYSDLKIEILRKNQMESQVGSFLVNNILIKKNNNSYFGARRGPIFYERKKHRSVINYLSHITIMGAKTSIGIEDKKTKRKIKNYHEENQ